MPEYLDLVALLNFLVDFLLLLGTNRLSGYPPEMRRVIPAAVLGGVYGGVCLLPGFAFLGGLLWRLVMLGAMSVIAFGFRRGTLRRAFVFILLSFALSGAVLGAGKKSFFSLVLSAAGITVLCRYGLRGSVTGKEFVPVEFSYGDRTWKLTALRDTGNMLRDPLTGERVLVMGADMGNKLLGLSPTQLSSPLETMTDGFAPGMRLIPYRSVGQPGAMLLAKRFHNVRVGNWKGDALFAFAPACIGQKGGFQILVGGTI